ncbi:hypothetical protein A8709_17870 [Paenibacillus pectinilyticus]|uniref:Uncharacterized protein n=1 Tax=Paenibacillus pectinilyticus TaxID=512399 RepID=A0A1C0ZZA9_9BACL|nr:endospore germination permease [Paenibacillus pectinilyticus]OCT13473.1 hypothetical protein A8709_17870 [Paenibacillus pectinilyticus]
MSTYDNAKISVRQFTILIILGVIGDSILILPTSIAKNAKQDSWLSMLLAILLGIAAAWTYAVLAKRLQRRSLFIVIREKLGIWIGSMFALLFLFEFYMCIIGLLSEMSQFMTAQLMPETPVNAIIVVFSIVMIFAYHYGIEAFSRMSELLFPVFMMLFIFLTVFLLPQVDMANLRPIAAMGISPILKGTLSAFAIGFTEMYIMLMLVSHVEGTTSLTKPIITGFVVGGSLLFIIVLLCVLVLGPNLMQTKYYPTFVLGQKITIGKFIERVEAIIAFLWFISVFYKTTILFYSFTSGIAQLLQLKESRMLTIPIAMLTLIGTIAVTPNITVYNDIISSYIWFDISFGFLLPLLLLLLLMLVNKRKKGNPSDNQDNLLQAQEDTSNGSTI